MLYGLLKVEGGEVRILLGGCIKGHVHTDDITGIQCLNKLQQTLSNAFKIQDSYVLYYIPYRYFS